jgi:uncharacterized membrane protein
MSEANPNLRLEFFCDAVFAIALTLLIIDIKLPSSVTIESTHDFWRALAQTLPSIFSFLLSFVVIFITWANHHVALKLTNKSSNPFIFANGLLLLSVVFIPFPTALLGEYLFTDHAAPAVMLYSAVCGFQAIGWNLFGRSMLKPKLLTKSEKATFVVRQNCKYSYFAMLVYAACAIAANWFPRAVAIAIALIWIVWLTMGITIQHE